MLTVFTESGLRELFTSFAEVRGIAFEAGNESLPLYDANLVDCFTIQVAGYDGYAVFFEAPPGFFSGSLAGIQGYTLAQSTRDAHTKVVTTEFAGGIHAGSLKLHSLMNDFVCSCHYVDFVASKMAKK